MKKLVFIPLAALLLFAAYMGGAGFLKNTSVILLDYQLSEDGSEITLTVSTTSSAGFVREVRAHQQQGGQLYLDFYRAFGGLNGSIGARSSFTVELGRGTDTIAFCRGENLYEPVLHLVDGTWQKAG